jgi:diadenosine tetraphosphate (Ap4A) HIT family hydrolase
MVVRLDKDQALEQLQHETRASAAFGGCVMCRLSHAQNSHSWLAESQHAVAVLDGFAASHGHLLVIAKAHVERSADVPWDVYTDLQRLVWEANRVLDAELEPKRVYVAALGVAKPLPMSFPHYHVHVVPVYETDERARPAHVFSWSAGVVRYSEPEARALSASLRRAWLALRPLDPHGEVTGGDANCVTPPLPAT